MTTTPLILRGSLITLRRKCGKPQCRCAAGQPHETPALSYSCRGKTYIQTLYPEMLPLVRQALARYQKASLELERQTQRGIAQLRRQMNQASIKNREKR